MFPYINWQPRSAETYRMPHSTVPLVAALKAARARKGLSQRALSARAGMPQSHLSKIESGAVDIRLSSFVQLARLLDLEPMLVPRARVPAVDAILRSTGRSGDTPPRPAYTLDDEDEDG
jgi:DNA-binding Xre family transcriptional regulator